MIFRAFLLALQSLSDRRIMMVFLKCIGLTLIILLAAGFIFWQAFNVLFDTLHFGIVGAGYVFATLGVFLLGWLLWRVIAITVLWFFPMILSML
jgi:CysZ protein